MALQDLTDPEAVLGATKEFDALGREAFLEKYGFKASREYVLTLNGRQYDSKPIVAAAHGRQHPDIGPLRHTEFNGGAQTTSKLRGLGFEVVRRNEATDGMTVDDLGGLLQRFLHSYAMAKGERFRGDHEAGLLLKQAAERIAATLPPALERAVVKPSVGQGNWAASPWIAVLDPRVTTTTQQGVYPVVLVRDDLSGLYATIAQGVTKLKRERGQREAYDALHRRATALRPVLIDLLPAGFTTGDDVYLGNSPLSRDYAASVIVSKDFEREGLLNSTVTHDQRALNEE